MENKQTKKQTKNTASTNREAIHSPGKKYFKTPIAQLGNLGGSLTAGSTQQDH